MKIIGLDGKSYSFNIKKTEIDDDNRSSFHLSARKIIEEIFPKDIFVEEVVLPGTDNLRADFFLPLRRVIFEVHGKQHYEFTSYFHKNLKDFGDSKKRDIAKIHWCRLNKIILVELDSRSTDGWPERIRDFFKYDSAGITSK